MLMRVNSSGGPWLTQVIHTMLLAHTTGFATLSCFSRRGEENVYKDPCHVSFLNNIRYYTNDF